ncbi:hypothetical protein O1611_g991 [Lasiodiplodia mahajangana]|uniref:Uncharacterized protein n=1 Tax=Lasiodiplodia mahajangana TaxID=1108764 RepID=A0ACC2JZK0_9PEZI|nr:hypothetical protein O1611_g991 [Lasiodiplodia mahajangana]
MTLYSDQSLAAAAVRAVHPSTPAQEAARKWDVDRSYIRRRIRGIPTRKQAYANLQALSIYYETQLANWAIGHARVGFVPSLFKLKLMAERMLKAPRRDRSLGKEWSARFLARNETAKSARSVSLDYTSVNGATAVDINCFLDRFEAPEVANIPLQRFFNADEMGNN